MQSLSLLIKPASSSCNLKCKYCFYADVTDCRAVKNTGMMSRDCTETMVKKAFATKARHVLFAFQGGEPTLAGLDYFTHFIDTVKENNFYGARCSFSLQTNGTLIDDKWSDFFVRNNFLVGLSLDGNREHHDFFRKDAKGDGTYWKVIAAARLLQRHNVDFNILTVVTDYTARHITKIYNYFKKEGFRYLQFIPCIEDFGVTDTDVPKLSIESYASFLITIFNLWLADFKQNNYISIRHIDNYIQMLAGNGAENCAMFGECGLYYVVEGDGSLYPCDFYCTDEYFLKTIFNDKAFVITPKHQEFLNDSKKLNKDCLNCRHYFICRGGCKRDREPDYTNNKYCKAYEAFFDHALQEMKLIALMQPKHNV